MSHANARSQQDPTGDGRPVLIEVISDLVVRREHGIGKYKHELKAENGRDPLVDLYQELLDAVMYAKQTLMERERLKSLSQFTPRELELMHIAVYSWYDMGLPEPLSKRAITINAKANELKDLATRLRDLVVAAVAPPAQSP